MTTRPNNTRIQKWLRSLALLTGTVGATMLVTILLTWLGFAAAILWIAAVLVVMPFLVAPLHLKLQAPIDSNIPLAFLTGFASWLVSLVFAVQWQLSINGS